MMARHAKEAVQAVVNGWRQDDSGNWMRPGTERDALTLHAKDDSLEGTEYGGEFGYVLASSPKECLRIDRETFGAERR
jgi:hypothetical protein